MDFRHLTWFMWQEAPPFAHGRSDKGTHGIMGHVFDEGFERDEAGCAGFPFGLCFSSFLSRYR